MPTPIYTIQIRGANIGGSYRCDTKEQAQGIYDSLAKGVNATDEFFEIDVQGQKATVRKSTISGFVMAVHMEETPEERKARAIEQIERGGDYYPGNALSAQCVTTGIGSSLI